MRYSNSRKYPITHHKKTAASNDPSFDLSLPAAVGILAVTLGAGMLGGYLLKR
jgi:hypothetical protein